MFNALSVAGVMFFGFSIGFIACEIVIILCDIIKK